MKESIGIVIPTFQAAKHLPHCLPPLLKSPLKPRILIIDSSSTDNTVEIARSMGVEAIVIPKNEFNHGATREKGRGYLKTTICIMITQDAYAATPKMLEFLIQPIIEKKASVSYGRQLPHVGANLFASFPREFNYPAISHIRNLQDISKYGIYTFFCSNSCAAYLNSALDEVGGFPHISFGEDTAVVAKLLHRHHSIAYTAEAEIYHSHEYSLKEQFSRHYAIGLSRDKLRELFGNKVSDHQRGFEFTKKLLREVWKKEPLSFFYAILETLAKVSGYECGKWKNRITLQFKNK